MNDAHEIQKMGTIYPRTHGGYRIDLSDEMQVVLGIADGALNYLLYPPDQWHLFPHHRCNDEVNDWLNANMVGHPDNRPYDLEIYPASGRSNFIFWSDRDAILFKLFWL
jgi:hypothetical protein